MQRTRAGRVAVGAVIALSTMALLVPVAPHARATEDDEQGDEWIVMYYGGPHPVTFDTDNDRWQMHDPLWYQLDPVAMWAGQDRPIAQVSVSGLALTQPDPECQHFRGVGEGTVAPEDNAPTYTIFNVAVEAGPGLPVMSGLWRDDSGREGTFAAYGYVVRIDISGACAIFIHNWGFARRDVTPQEILARLQERLPGNTAPNPPDLESPPNGHVFLTGQLQIFSVQTTDPEQDPYFGLVRVRRPNGTFEQGWPTSLVESGDRSDGVPPAPYGPDTGYEWKATAHDGRLESAPSEETRTFSVS